MLKDLVNLFALTRHIGTASNSRGIIGNSKNYKIATNCKKTDTIGSKVLKENKTTLFANGLVCRFVFLALVLLPSAKSKMTFQWCSSILM